MKPQQSIYLDHAAATPLDPQVLTAMQPFLTTEYYNPSATYAAARHVAAELEAARALIAHWLGSRSTEVIFTAGGTEANNLAIDGIMRQYPEGNIVVSAIEHDAVLQPSARYDCRIAPVTAAGLVDIKALATLIDDQTVLVSVMYANNEVGSVQPLRQIAQVINQKRGQRNDLPLYFHTDACQAGNYLDLHVSRLGVDMMTINGSKLYGPKQSGALYVSSRVQLEPVLRGGGQERNRRSGTENVAQDIGLAAALNIAQINRKSESTRLLALQNYFINSLQVTCSNSQINGSLVKRLANNLHISFPGIDNERLLMQLDDRGVQAAAGSACTASDDQPSHVLRAMGINDELAQSSIRLTMGRTTTKADIDYVLSVLKDLVPGQ